MAKSCPITFALRGANIFPRKASISFCYGSDQFIIQKRYTYRKILLMFVAQSQ